MSLESVIQEGVVAIIAIAIMFALVQAALSYKAQRNLSDLHSLGMQAIIATNEMLIVDEAMERRRNKQS